MQKKFKLLMTPLSVLIVAGCAAPDNKIQAEYVMPPREIKDIHAVSPVMIIAKAELTGNCIGKNDKMIVECDLTQRVAARLNSEGYYTTTDILCGDDNGPAELQKLMQAKHHPHGYDIYSSDKIKCAKLEICLKAEVARQDRQVKKTYNLKHIPYKRLKGKIPSSAPNEKAISIKKEVATIVEHSIDGTGAISVKLYDKHGALVYNKSFNGLKYHQAVGFKDISALPVNTAVIARMIMPPIYSVVKDISPHSATRTIEINEDGDEKAVLLLKAHAYSEAIITLDKLINSNEAETADLENMAIAMEIIGDYQMARDLWEQVLADNSENIRAKQGIERITSVIKSQRKLHKQKVKKKNDFRRKLNQVNQY